MFAVKIDAAAKQSSLLVNYAKSPEDALIKGQERPALVIIDLNNMKLDPIALIRSFKESKELNGLNLLGFISHVDAEKKQLAIDAGCDSVVPRSAFSVNLPKI